MVMIGESGIINLIQYYRNLLMDIMNTESTLPTVQGSKEQVRVKFNKVLTKILVFLRLNALFTDYILMNGVKSQNTLSALTKYTNNDALALLALPMFTSGTSTKRHSSTSSVLSSNPSVGSRSPSPSPSSSPVTPKKSNTRKITLYPLELSSTSPSSIPPPFLFSSTTPITLYPLTPTSS
jgi:hypothetical protein